MPTRKDINLLIASSVQQHSDYTVGMDDMNVFLMTDGPSGVAKVFRIRVEEIEKISKHPQAREQAELFMRTLPYGPD